MTNGKRTGAKGRRWKEAGKIRIGGDHGLFKRLKGRLYRDLLTGRFRSAKQAKRGERRTIPITIDRDVRPLPKSGMVEVGYRAKYRVKIPLSLRRKKPGAIVDAVIRKMREDGHKKLPPRGKGRKKRDRVRFFWFLEGQAYDERAKKRIRAGVGGVWRRSLDTVALEGKSKIRGLFEGRRMSNLPFKTTGSGQWTMESGPDTIYITAVYGKDVPVPGVDFKVKRRKRRK